MSGFSAEWLALREPVDAVARSGEVTDAALRSPGARGSLRVLDLGGGTGSNIRYLAARAGTSVQWRLVDHDPELLAVARHEFGANVEIIASDLRELDPSIFDDVDLVTASALLDLVSDAWLRSFVRQCRRADAAVLVALNYDGRLSCDPVDEDDEFVRGLVNHHQRTDKGFGPALGPESGARAATLLREAGYEVVIAPSDWQIGPEHAELQRQLVQGWAGAAIEASAGDADRIRAWETRRLAHVDAGRSHIVVGHEDLAGRRTRQSLIAGR